MKKYFLFAAGLALALLFSAQSFAQTTGYDGGFFIKNEEGTFKLKFNGRIQNSFYYQKSGVSEGIASFRLRRAVLKSSFNMHERVSGGFELKHAIAPGGAFDTVGLGAAHVAIDIIPDKFTIDIGQVGLPLDMITDTSSSAFILTESPITATRDDGLDAVTPTRPSFGAPDGLGINFSGGINKWYYSLSVVNGAESNYLTNGSTDQPKKRFSAGFRTAFNILDPVPGSLTDYECSSTPKLTISAGTMYQGKRDVQFDTASAGNDSTINYFWTSSLGIGLRWGGLAFTGEGYYRRTKMTTTLPTLWYFRNNVVDVGYYAALGYYVIPKKLELALQAGQSIRQGPQNDSWQFGGGINYYIFQKNVKIQFDYTLTKYFNSMGKNAAGIIGLQDERKHLGTMMLTTMF